MQQRARLENTSNLMKSFNKQLSNTGGQTGQAPVKQARLNLLLLSKCGK